MTNLPVFELLRADVKHTQDEYTQSKQDFWTTSGRFPVDSNRIELAAHAQTVAMLAYTKALHRFNEFLLTGKIPDELLSKYGVVPPTTGFSEEQRQVAKCAFCGAETRMFENDHPICEDCAGRIDAGGRLIQKEPAKTREKTKSVGR